MNQVACTFWPKNAFLMFLFKYMGSLNTILIFSYIFLVYVDSKLPLFYPDCVFNDTI